MLFGSQPEDCLATIPPYPHYVGDRGDVYDGVSAVSDPDNMWVVSPQLFFQCTLRPLKSTRVRYNHSAEGIPLDLVFFSTFDSGFEGLRLQTTGTMESNGIRKLYAL